MEVVEGQVPGDLQEETDLQDLLDRQVNAAWMDYQASVALDLFRSLTPHVNVNVIMLIRGQGGTSGAIFYSPC